MRWPLVAGLLGRRALTVTTQRGRQWEESEEADGTLRVSDEHPTRHPRLHRPHLARGVGRRWLLTGAAPSIPPSLPPPRWITEFPEYNTTDLAAFVAFYMGEQLGYLTEGQVIVSQQDGVIKVKVEGECETTRAVRANAHAPHAPTRPARPRAPRAHAPHARACRRLGVFVASRSSRAVGSCFYRRRSRRCGST
eukprot:6789950-Prymnesium_polylepis.1